MNIHGVSASTMVAIAWSSSLHGPRGGRARPGGASAVAGPGVRASPSATCDNQKFQEQLKFHRHNHNRRLQTARGPEDGTQCRPRSRRRECRSTFGDYRGATTVQCSRGGRAELELQQLSWRDDPEQSLSDWKNIVKAGDSTETYRAESLIPLGWLIPFSHSPACASPYVRCAA